MPYCQNCGKQISDDAKVCGYCGVSTGAYSSAQDNYDAQNNPNPQGYTQPNWNNQNQQNQQNQQGYTQPNWNNQNQQNQQGYNQPNWNNQNPYGQPNMYGQNQQPYNPYPQQNNFYNVNNDGAKAWEVILSILFPIIGLIFFITNKDTRPRASKTCGICALVAFIVSFVLGFIGGILSAALSSSSVRYSYYALHNFINIL